MILLEGRKEDIYNKYKGQIDTERKLNSSFQPISIYDVLIDEPFIQQTNYKYLGPLIQQYYFLDEIYPRQGKELEELEPNSPLTSINTVRNSRNFVSSVVPKVQYFDVHKDKYPKKDLIQYVGDWFDKDFLDFTDGLIKQTSKKQEEKKAQKEVEKIYDSDSILIVKPKSHKASCYYGAGTKWCTTMKDNPSHFESHTKNSNLYYVIIKKKNVSDRFYKIAINIKPNQKLIDSDFYDVLDNMLNFSEKDLFLTIIPKGAVESINNDLKLLKDSWFTSELIPQITQTGLMQESKQFILTISKKLIIAYGFMDFEYSDYLGDDEDGDNKFQRFECSYRMSEFNKETQLLEDPDVNSTFYETGLVYGIVRESDDEQNYELSLSFVKTDKYNNNFFYFSDGPILTFNKGKYFSSSMREYMMTVFNQIFDSEKFKEILKNYVDDNNISQKYTMAGYTFKKGGKLTKELIKYVDSLSDDQIGNKLDFLKKTGQVNSTPDGNFNRKGERISLQGYLSSFFAAAKQAGIIQKPEGKKGFVKGPKINKFKKKFELN